MQGNIQHVMLRLKQRGDSTVADRIAACLNGLSRKFKAKSMPNTAWYRPVTVNGSTMGYIVGQGCYVSSYLAGDMAPHGVRV